MERPAGPASERLNSLSAFYLCKNKKQSIDLILRLLTVCVMKVSLIIFFLNSKSIH